MTPTTLRSSVLLAVATCLYAVQAGEHARTPSREPHPITAEHLRLYREVDLLAGIRRAIAAQRFDEARSLLREHRTEYPARAHDDNLGLTLLLECTQRPSADARARAQRFYDARVHSMLRRSVRRACLEPARGLSPARS